MTAQEIKTCLVCRRAFEKKPGVEFDMCPECLRKMGERYDSPASDGESPRPRSKAPLWTVIAVCAAISGVQVPRVKQALALLFPPAPEAISPTADPKDLCIANLWNISGQIQKGLHSTPKEVCPLTKKPYRTSTVNGDFVVSCPNPAAHGLKVLQVSRNSPTPEASSR